MAAGTFATGPVRHAYKWTITSLVDGREWREGKEYTRVMVSSEGHVKSDPTPTYYRAAPDGLYLAVVRDGQWREAQLLAFPPDVGRAWVYDDGTASRLRIAGVEAVTTPAGTFQDCLRVVREFLAKEQAEQFSQETHYCPGVGEVKEVFRQRLRNRTSENLKVLVSTRPHGAR